MVVERVWAVGDCRRGGAAVACQGGGSGRVGAVVTAAALAVTAVGCSSETEDVGAAEQAVIGEALAAAGVEELPLDAHWLPEEQRVAFEQQLLPKVVDCLAARGFTVTPEQEVTAEPATVQNVLRYGVVSKARAAKYAYNPTPEEYAMSQTPHRALPILLGSVVTDEALKAVLGDSTTPDEDPAVDESGSAATDSETPAPTATETGGAESEDVAGEAKDQGCYAEVLAEMTDVADARAYHDQVSQLGELTVQADGQARTAQGTVDASEKWGECMRGKGYAEATDPWAVYSLVGADPAQTPEEPGEFAIEVATADVECKQETGFVTAYVAELVKAHQAVAEENSDLLDQLDEVHTSFTGT